MTHRDRSAYKTRASERAVSRSVTIAGMTGHVRRNTQHIRKRGTLRSTTTPAATPSPAMPTGVSPSGSRMPWAWWISASWITWWSVTKALCRSPNAGGCRAARIARGNRRRPPGPLARSPRPPSRPPGSAPWGGVSMTYFFVTGQRDRVRGKPVQLIRDMVDWTHRQRSAHGQ